MVPVPPAPGHRNFVLALTVGLLVFLALDTLLEAVEIAGELPGRSRGAHGYPRGPLDAARAPRRRATIQARTRRGEQARDFLPDSPGIGLHNLGEGLAIGAAFALGETALGTFLILGFTLHNITEGVGIAAPVLRRRGRPWRTSPRSRSSVETGHRRDLDRGFAYSNLLSAVLAVESGQSSRSSTKWRDSSRETRPARSAPLSGTNLGGLTAGIAIMYATALLVSV